MDIIDMMDMEFATMIGHIAAILTTASFVPQTLKVIRSKDTTGISLPMYLIMLLGIVFWITYGILNHLMPIILCNIITFVFVVTILVYKLKALLAKKELK